MKHLRIAAGEHFWATAPEFGTRYFGIRTCWRNVRQPKFLEIRSRELTRLKEMVPVIILGSVPAARNTVECHTERKLVPLFRRYPGGTISITHFDLNQLFAAQLFATCNRHLFLLTCM